MTAVPTPRPKLRSTKQRAAVIAALGTETGFRSAQDLHNALRSEGNRVGLTTVYRTLQALADAGEVDALRTDDGEVVYRRCNSGEHHHHLVCRQCGLTVEIDGPEVEQWADRLARKHRFTDLSHTLEVFGRCRACGTIPP